MSNLNTKLSVREIQAKIVAHHGGPLRVLAVPNVSYGLLIGGYEADLIVVSRQWYATEYEIKRSWQDFLADFRKKEKAHFSRNIYNFAYVVPESMAERVREYLESHFTKYDMPCAYSFPEDGQKLTKLCGNLHPQIREDKGCNRALDLEEMFTLARLGTIRYWYNSLKCSECPERKRELPVPKKEPSVPKKEQGVYEVCRGDEVLKRYKSWLSAERAIAKLIDEYPDEEFQMRWAYVAENQ